MKNLIFLFLLVACFAAKEQQTYSISGTITDNKGLLLPGTTVFFKRYKFAVATDMAGSLKIIVQGITGNEVTCGQATFNVIKTK